MSDAQRIAKFARQASSAKVLLEQAIRSGHAQGMSLRSIASAANMSHEQVRRIVARPGAPKAD